MNRRSFLKFAAILTAIPVQVFAWVRNRIWYPRNGPQLTEALRNAGDGDMIILEAGKKYKAPPHGFEFDLNKHLTVISSEMPK